VDGKWLQAFIFAYMRNILVEEIPTGSKERPTGSKGNTVRTF
jgi:hypothetical protein